MFCADFSDFFLASSKQGLFFIQVPFDTNCIGAGDQGLFPVQIVIRPQNAFHCAQMAQVYGQVESLTRLLRALEQVGHKGLSRLDQVLQLRTEVDEAYGFMEDQQYALLDSESIALEEEAHQLQIAYEQALADRVKKQEAELLELDEQLERLRSRGQENIWLWLRTVLSTALINIYRNARQDRFARQRQSFMAREERPVRELKAGCLI